MTALAPMLLMQPRPVVMTERPNPALALLAVFEQLADLLLATSDEQYVQSPVGEVTSSLGGHIRHNLDHVASLLNALPTGRLNYDHRERGTNIETSRRAALQAIRHCQRVLLDLDIDALQVTLQLETLFDASEPPILVDTTMMRELAFVLSHTIHHNAIIGIMAKTLGIALPSRFGYAPSTIAHQEKRACAR
jgi:uncharacterized damage-inducible protein DinB